MQHGQKVFLMSDTNKLKILAIIPSGFCFGLQHITVDYFSHFPPFVKSHFLLTKWNDGELAKLLENNHIDYSYSWLGMFSRKLDWYNLKMSLISLSKLPRLYYDFAKLLRKIKPDMLYFANHHELIILYPALLFTRRKIVCHMHDPSPAISFQKKTFKWYGRKVNIFIAISDNVRLRTIELGCNPDKIHTVHNGIKIPDLDGSERRDDFCKIANWPENVFIIGITGQMTETKGHSDLLEAFKLMFKRNPLVRLVIGGKHTEPLYGQLKEKIAQGNLNDVVFFTGWVGDVNRFFKNINAFVLASRHDEGYGLVVAKAMAYKLPVVITRSGGAVELVEDGISGFIVEKKDIVGMSERLYELSKNAELTSNMGINARIRMEKNFNLKVQADKLVNCFNEIANS